MISKIPLSKILPYPPGAYELKELWCPYQHFTKIMYVLHIVVFCYALVATEFTHILQGYFHWHQCQWSNLEEYG